MKKLYIFLLLIFNLNFLFSEDYIIIDNKKISLDSTIEEIQNLFGIQNELSVIPFEYNSDWDTFCYKYESFTVYSSRITKMPYRIEVTNGNFVFNVNGFVIQSESSKTDVESMLQELKFVGKNDKHNELYLYNFPYLMEAGFAFDSNQKLKSIYISYAPMD